MINQQSLDSAVARIEQAKTLDELEKLRVELLGRKGLITAALRSISSVDVAERAQVGERANQAKQKIDTALAQRKRALQSISRAAQASQSLDLTAPAAGSQIGHLHPVESIQQELVQLFWQAGFKVAEGPEVETDWYNFEALNQSPDHPARDMQDTFYLENGAVMRTHTSAVQVRYMEAHQPPVRIIAPGKVYRNENEDATHGWAFTNLEGLVVDEAISLADLKGTLLYMLKGLFGNQAEVRLRPNYFPYVEPGLEADASCITCEGRDSHCRLCKGTGWIELLGAGMVHPQVLRNVKIDPVKYSGFAFGVGLERLAVIKYGINDVRALWRPDLKFLEQF